MKQLTTRSALLMVATLSLVALHGPVNAQVPQSGRFEVAPVGTPFGTGKLVSEFTLVVDGKKVTKTVTIPSGDIKAYVKLTQMMGEANKDFAQRVFDARGEASQAKAKVIVDAINAEFKAEFAKIGDKAGTGLQVQTGKIRVGVIDYTVTAPFGAYVVPAVLKEKVRAKDGSEIEKPAVTIIEGKILGEGGNGGKFLKDEKPSAGMRGSLGRVDPQVATIATGFDPFGDPSDVEIGVAEIFVAHYTPTFGQTDRDVLAALAFILGTNGLAATFDPLAMELFLDSPIADGNTFVWGNTDTGFEFLTAFTPLNAAVAEPGSTVLLLVGLLALLMTSQFRRGRSSFICTASV